ncbi:uncharacterized protein LOC131060757 isoform X2 [Cryptomeria japonica]|uniref:uncharacterized protein LOC131060757 isoform X2 n=1 Tax=Cryptomeria japonica TaxID=3369 RepID=UPI0027DA23E2|nr:uncharacterized protein LOC131060757 isoform X2 [Cryptomeria japonica]
MKTYHNISSLAALLCLTLLLQPLFSHGVCNMGSIEIKQFMLEEKWEQEDMMRGTYYVSISNSGCLDTACLPYNEGIYTF